MLRLAINILVVLGMLSALPLLVNSASAAEAANALAAATGGHPLHRDHARHQQNRQDHNHHGLPHQQEHKHHGDRHQPAAQAMFNAEPEQARGVDIRLDDGELLDQDGVRRRFASDLIGDRLVALTVFYSTCTTVCPVISAIFAELQDRLDARLGEEVVLLSLTVDPTTDRPRRLKAYAAQYGARPGWSWLTGEKRAVDRVLSGLGLYTPDFTQHPLTVLVGDRQRNRWTRFYGFPGPELILAELDRLQAARLANDTGTLAGE